MRVQDCGNPGSPGTPGTGLGIATGSRGSGGPGAGELLEARGPHVTVEALLDACCKPGGMLGYKVGGESRQSSHAALVRCIGPFVFEGPPPRGSRYLSNTQGVASYRRL